MGISDIQLENQESSARRRDGDDLTEMEKLLNSGGGFGGQMGKKDLRDTFKKIRGELAQEEANSRVEPQDSAQKSALESDLDIPMHENSSPGGNTFVRN